MTIRDLVPSCRSGMSGHGLFCFVCCITLICKFGLLASLWKSSNVAVGGFLLQIQDKNQLRKE